MHNAAVRVEAIPKLTYEQFRQLPDDGFHLTHRESHGRGFHREIRCRGGGCVARWPLGRAPSLMLGEALRKLGFEIGCLKTGSTPKR